MLHKDCGSDAMLFDIEPKSPVPIYEQIVAQVTFGIAVRMAVMSILAGN